MNRELTCIACPVGCPLVIELDENNKVVSVTGNQCKRGINYAETECTSPTRSLTTTAKVEGGIYPLVPMKSANPVPKGKMLECMKVINAVVMKAPVKIGDIVVKDILGTGVDIVATNICPEA